jgi:hypothetical protein
MALFLTIFTCHPPLKQLQPLGVSDRRILDAILNSKDASMELSDRCCQMPSPISPLIFQHAMICLSSSFVQVWQSLVDCQRIDIVQDVLDRSSRAYNRARFLQHQHNSDSTSKEREQLLSQCDIIHPPYLQILLRRAASRSDPFMLQYLVSTDPKAPDFTFSVSDLREVVDISYASGRLEQFLFLARYGGAPVYERLVDTYFANQLDWVRQTLSALVDGVEKDDRPSVRQYLQRRRHEFYDLARRARHKEMMAYLTRWNLK